MPVLVAHFRFNPPVLNLMGTTLREETIHKLDSKMFSVTTTSHSPKQDPPKFAFINTPPHWQMTMPKFYCDHLGRSSMFLAVVEAMEAEDWMMVAAHGFEHRYECWKSVDAGMDGCRIFFCRE
eukprot:NODE_2545_length_678_cov_96.801272_g2085_i0.p1 GENE.NODE_2545_length_678_cov_96.801272_g2085_i0~~NODE_2545_length_678_cov_96.801272_g2085_i0.p1  ORF type:complete len:142 (-),score=56.85 NODE_2545_length_678_cov_96.801272_g2085_i0:252-620(-)